MGIMTKETGMLDNKLVEKKITDYLELLGSEAPAPGGGAAGALAGAQGAALGIMVIDLTLGKQKYAEYQELCIGTRDVLAPLQKKLTESVDKDASAFGGFASAMKMPKDTEEEKAARRQALIDAAKYATEVPFETMNLCFEALKAIQPLPGKTNINAVSDIGVAAYELLSGIKASWLNVKINLPSLKDEELAGYYREKSGAILKESQNLAESIYAAVESML